MSNIVSLLILLIFIPPAIGLFVLVKRLKEGKQDSGAKERLFEALLEENIRKRNNPEENVEILSETVEEPEEIEKPEEIEVVENIDNDKQKKEEAVNMVMNMLKSQKNKKSSSDELQDMIKLLSDKNKKTGR